MDRENYSIPTTREEAIAFRAIQWTRGAPAVKRVQAEAAAVKFLGPKPPKDPTTPKLPKDPTAPKPQASPTVSAVASAVAVPTVATPVAPKTVIAKTPPVVARPLKFVSAEEEMEWMDNWRRLCAQYDPTFAPGKVW